MSKDGRGDDGTGWFDSSCSMSRTLAEPHSTFVQLNAYSWVLDDNERERVRPIDVGNNKDCGEVARHDEHDAWLRRILGKLPHTRLTGPPA